MKIMNNKGVKAVTLMLTLDEMYRAAGCEPYDVSLECLAEKTGVPAKEVELLVEELSTMESKMTLKIRIPGLNLRSEMEFNALAVYSEKFVREEPLGRSVKYTMLSSTGLRPSDALREFTLKAEEAIAAGRKSK